MRKGNKVILTGDHPNGIRGSGPPRVKGTIATVIAGFWANGEGYLTLKFPDGTRDACPDIFWDLLPKKEWK